MRKHAVGGGGFWAEGGVGEGAARAFPPQLNERSRNQSEPDCRWGADSKDQATVQTLRALRFRWPRLKTSLMAVSPSDSLN